MHNRMHSNFARQDVSKSGECVVESFVINGFIQVLDEDVANSRFAQRRISLGPHDANGGTIDRVKVHGVQSSFS